MPVIAFVDRLGVREKLVRQDDVGLAPVVIAERLEQAAVQERDAAFEAVAPCLVAAIRGKRVVKERFKDVVEEVLVACHSRHRKPAQEIVRASAPILPFGHAEPAFFCRK